MKIIRFKAADNRIAYGKVEEGVISRIEGNIFFDFSITEDKHEKSEVDLLAPINPPNIIAVGLNYYDHARETGHEIPEEPVLFLKATTSITGPETDIKLPKIAPERVDYEAELGIIIGKGTKNIAPEEAEEAIFGFTCVNDVTARDCQKNDGQWARAKSFDTFCPVGPEIATPLGFEDCRISSKVNGEIRQEASTADMIFSVPEIVSYCSRNMTLLPGTLITTGTPAGVGVGLNPPEYLEAGDRVVIEIEDLGRLVNVVEKE